MWPSDCKKRERSAGKRTPSLKPGHSTREWDDYWRSLSRVLAGSCIYWLSIIKKGWVTSAFEATQWQQLQSHKKITPSYVTRTDAATPPLRHRFGDNARPPTTNKSVMVCRVFIWGVVAPRGGRIRGVRVLLHHQSWMMGVALSLKMPQFLGRCN